MSDYRGVRLWRCRISTPVTRQRPNHCAKLKIMKTMWGGFISRLARKYLRNTSLITLIVLLTGTLISHDRTFVMLTSWQRKFGKGSNRNWKHTGEIHKDNVWIVYTCTALHRGQIVYKTCLQGTLRWEDTLYTVKPVFMGHSDERTTLYSKPCLHGTLRWEDHSIQ